MLGFTGLYKEWVIERRRSKSETFLVKMGKEKARQSSKPLDWAYSCFQHDSCKAFKWLYLSSSPPKLQIM
jgi:hypothetical protein